MLVLQSLHGLSIDKAEYLVRGRGCGFPNHGRRTQFRMPTPSGDHPPADHDEAAQHEGLRLREKLIDHVYTAGNVWAADVCRSAEDEEWLTEHGITSRTPRKKPRGRPLPL